MTERGEAKPSRKMKATMFLIIGLLVCLISPYIILACFSVPSSDDFLQAYHAVTKGVLGFVSSRYMHWNGRYSADFVISFYNVVGHRIDQNFLFKFYFLVPLSLLTVFCGASYAFISDISGSRQTGWKIAFSLLLLLLMLSTVELRSTVFWLAGGITYVLGSAMFLIMFAVIVSTIYIKRTEEWEVGKLTLAVFLISFVNGFNEVLMVANATFIASLLMLGLLLRNLRVIDYFRLLYFQLFSVGSAFIVVLAPGNGNRMAVNGQSIGLFAVAKESLLSSLHYSFTSLSPLLITGLVLLTGLLAYSLTSELKAYVRDRCSFLTVVVSLGLALGMSYFVRYYSLGSIGPARADFVSFLLLFLLLFHGCLYLCSLERFTRLRDMLSRYQTMLAVTGIFSVLSISTSVDLLGSDFRGLEAHRTYYQTLYSTLSEIKTESVVEVQPEPKVAVLRWKCDLTDDDDYWVNQSIAKYFNVTSIVAVGSGPPAGECGGLDDYDPTD